MILHKHKTKISKFLTKSHNKLKSYIYCFLLLIFGHFITIISGQVDSRCFLKNGGSSISFFVSEDVPIGHNLGVLGIEGDVSRDIFLKLRESTAPVRIESNSKNLTLIKKLDKEGVEGPSTVSFTILCDKKFSSEPSIGIPVTIRVSDVNDNKPMWLDGPFSINVSEQTLPGSTIMTGLKAIDMDQHGPYSTLTFSALDSVGRTSDMVQFAGGGFEGRLILIRPLDYESMPYFNLTLRVSDHGIPPLFSDTILRVNVIDSDDLNPRFEYVSYSAVLPRNAKKGTILEIDPGPIRAFDQDTTINAPLKLTLPKGRRENEYFRLDDERGSIILTRDIPHDQLNQPITLVLKAEQIDNPDRYAISTLSIGKQGSHSAPLHFSQSEFRISVPENSPKGTILFTPLINSRSSGNLVFELIGDRKGQFSTNGVGQIVLSKGLDYEEEQKYSLKLIATDGFQNASTVVHLNVLNVNDWAPRFRESFYEFNISSPLEEGVPVGSIEVADGDLEDRISLEIKNTNLVRIDGNGLLYLRNKTIKKREIMFLVVAKDSGDPPREAFVPVVLRLMGDTELNYLTSSFDGISIALFSSLIFIVLAISGGILLYFTYCRKRRKIQSENFQKRLYSPPPLTPNIHNPLALHKLLPHNNSIRRSNKIRNMSIITPPVLINSTLTPLDPIDINNGANGTIGRKQVSFSPKIKCKSVVNPMVRHGGNEGENRGSYTSRTTIVNGGEMGSNGFEMDPDTSVTPLETYNLAIGDERTKNDTLHSTSSLTLYF